MDFVKKKYSVKFLLPTISKIYGRNDESLYFVKLETFHHLLKKALVRLKWENGRYKNILNFKISFATSSKVSMNNITYWYFYHLLVRYMHEKRNLRVRVMQ